MFKIGIIGAENSHAMEFARFFNLPNPKTGDYDFVDARVIGVFGPDKDAEKEIMDKVGVDFIAKTPEDFVGKVDAMVITSRSGSVHYEYAMPFIKMGMPVYVDKPITSDNSQVIDMMKQAKENNVLMTGGSGCKLVYDILTLKNNARAMIENGTLCSGAINFTLHKDSIYDGIFFYASHLTEMALTVFGYDMKSIIATEKNGTVVATARYENFDITMHYTNGSTMYSCVIFGQPRNIYREIDITGSSYFLAVEFMKMLRTKVMPQSYDEIAKPVFVISAIVESLQTGKEVCIASLGL